MGVFKEIERADGSGVTTFYRISDVQDTVETDDSEGTATVIDYNQAQNKPSINGVALVGNKTSEDLGLQPAGDYITNDEADAKFIDEDELEAYNYVNETQLQEAIANIDHFHREIVAALPVTGQDNVLYLVRKEGSGEDIYNEYIWVGRSYSEDGYEFIGTTATDLTDYYQKSEVNALLNNKVDKVDGKGLSEQNYTLSEKTKLAGLHNYDDTELQVKVANLHNYDDTDLQLRVGDLEVKEEADINAIQTIQDALDKKMICIRLVEQGDGWTWMDINGSRLTYNKAQAYLGQENCMLFVEQLENDGKVIPAEYKSETTRTRVIFKDLDSLVHILTLGEEDLLVEDTISTEDGLADFEVENEAVDFGARLDAFYGNTSQETITGEAGAEVVNTSILINDVNTDKENYITLKGNTAQENYTGKNLLNYNILYAPGTTQTIGGVTVKFNTDGSITLNGTMTGNNIEITGGVNVLQLQVDNTKTYYSLVDVISGSYSAAAAPVLAYDCKYNGGADTYYRNYRLPTSPTSTQIDVSNTEYITRYRIWQNNPGDAVFNNYTVKFAVYEADDSTDWEPYVGNTAAPNPDYPQEVKVVKGENTLNICGKNLLKITATNSSMNGIDYTIDNNGGVTADGTRTGSSFAVLCDYSSSNLFKAGTYIFSLKNSLTNIGACRLEFSTTRNSVDRFYVTDVTSNKVITLNQDGYLKVSYIISTADRVNNFYNEFQIEVGSISTTYEPYQGQTYNFSLGDIELCKIGTYQDYLFKKEDKWYLHKEIGKVVLDGTESDWIKNSNTTYSNSVSRYNVPIIGKKRNINNTTPDNIFSDRFISRALDDFETTRTTNSICGHSNNDTFNIFIEDAIVGDTTLTAFKTWLSNNNIIGYYVLETPTDTLVTNSTLSSQLDALHNATLYPTTNINTETNNLLPYIDLKYNVITPAPSPDRESEIKVVKGNNIIKVHNKNYIYDAKHNAGTTNTYGGVDYTLNTDGSIYVNGTASSNYNYYLMDEASGLLTLTPGTYTLSGGINQNAWVRLFDGTTYYDTDLHDKTFALTETTSFKVCLRVKSGTTVQDYFKPMLEKTSSATTFEKYKGQNFPLSLGNIELCKIGNYQDKIYKQNNTWYLHKEIGKAVLNGSENWSKNSGVFYISSVTDYAPSSNTPKSNYYIGANNVSGANIAYNKGNNHICFINSTSPARLYIRNDNVDTTDDFKNWLSTYNTTVYYVLGTPTDTEITDATLLTQLENLQQITQYKHTYIELIPNTNNEMPEADFTYIRNAVINSSDNILGKDTYWNDEVPTSADLPSNAQEGEIRIVQDTQNVYIYDGYEWIPFDKGGEVDLSNYLAKDNTTAWVPTSAFNPATKKYVDDSVNGIFVPTKTSQLTNDSNFIGVNSNNLTYYYTKSQTYNKSEVDALIHGGGGGGSDISITVSGDTLVITTQSN